MKKQEKFPFYKLRRAGILSGFAPTMFPQTYERRLLLREGKNARNFIGEEFDD